MLDLVDLSISRVHTPLAISAESVEKLEQNLKAGGVKFLRRNAAVLLPPKLSLFLTTSSTLILDDAPTSYRDGATMHYAYHPRKGSAVMHGMLSVVRSKGNIPNTKAYGIAIPANVILSIAALTITTMISDRSLGSLQLAIWVAHQQGESVLLSPGAYMHYKDPTLLGGYAIKQISKWLKSNYKIAERFKR